MYNARLMPALVILVVITSGCSQTIKNAPTVPPPPIETGSINDTSGQLIWGFWEIGFNPGELTVDIEPVRDIQAHYDITSMVQPPACDDCLLIQVNSYDPVTQVLDVDVTLRNAFALVGHDVRGIFFTTNYGHTLENADGWTSLFDIPGGDTINPFMAFAKSSNQRAFPPGYVDTNKYMVYLPEPPQYWAIKFAGETSWPGNCKEPYAIDNFSQTELGSSIGSTADIQVQVHDWQNNTNQVTLQAQEITGDPFTSLSHIYGDTWGAEITNSNGVGDGEYAVRINARSEDSGTLALYQEVTIAVEEASADPCPWGWAGTFGSSDQDWLHEVKADSMGNVYMSGFFNGTVDFDPGPGYAYRTSNGGSGLWGGDIFLCKYDSCGELVYALTWGSYSIDAGYSVSLDSDGNVYASGCFHKMTDFDPGPGEEWHTPVGDWDAFLSKFDPEGNFLWVETWGGSLDEIAIGIEVDKFGNCFAAGHTKSQTTEKDVFLRKFDPDGNTEWYKVWGSTGPDEGRGIDVDSYGNAFVLGYFSSTADFDPGPGVENHTAAGAEDVFFSRFKPNGDWVWTQTWGGTQSDRGWGVAMENDDYVYATGYIGVSGKTDGYLKKFSTSGVEQWSKTWGAQTVSNTASNEIDFGDGHVFVTGYFNGTVDFDPGPGMIKYSSNGYDDVFLSKFSTSGDLIWARAWGGNNVDYGTGISVDGYGNVYTGGHFQNSVDFAPDGGDIHNSNGLYDIFLVKHLSAGNW